MKLSLRFLIPLVGITALSVSTPAADMMSHSGQARTRLELMKNVGAANTDWTEQWLNRVRLNVDISPSKTLMVRLTPQATYTWGAVGNTAAANNDAGLTAQEAWMSWTASDMMTLYVGRQMLEYGKGLIIGYNDWGQTNNYFDMARARFTFDMGTTDFFFSRIVNRPIDTGNNNLFGIYSSLNPDMGILRNLDLYFLWNDNPHGGLGRSRLGSLGFRAEGDIHVVDYNAEVTGQYGQVNNTGTATSQKGVQINAEAGTKVAGAHHVSAMVQYANSEFYDQFPSQHGRLGKSDILTNLNNILAIAVKTSWKLHDKWKAGVDGWYSMAAKDDLGYPAGGLARTAGTASGRQVAMEGDLTLGYSPEKNLTFEAGYNIFKGMSGIKPANNTYSGLYLQGLLNF